MNLERKLKNEELESIAVFVHGTLFGLHALGAFYNLTKGRYRDAAIHVAVAVYDVVATRRHYKHYEKLINREGS